MPDMPALKTPIVGYEAKAYMWEQKMGTGSRLLSEQEDSDATILCEHCSPDSAPCIGVSDVEDPNINPK